MNWEEELVLRNSTRKVKFDKDLIKKTMLNICIKIKLHADKYNSPLRTECIPLSCLDILDMSGEIKLSILFIFNENDTELIIGIKEGNYTFARITLEENYYLVKYENLIDEYKTSYPSRKYYDLSEEILSEIIGNVVKLHDFF